MSTTMNNNLPTLSNEGGLSAYLEQIKKFPMLAAEEEYMLAKNWKTTGNIKAAEYLDKHNLVEWVRFPGLKGDPAFELSEKYLQGTGGTMVVFGIKGGKDAGQKFIDNLKMFRHVANVGDTRSLAIHPATTTHSQLDEDQLIAAGSPPELIRLSIGIEDIEDILGDLGQALESAS